MAQHEKISLEIKEELEKNLQPSWINDESIQYCVFEAMAGFSER